MGLSRQSTAKAFEILSEINNGFGGYEIEDVENDHRTGIILVSDPKSDGGFESVVLQLRNINPEKVDIFKSRSKEIPNSSIFRTLEEDKEVTRLGWF